jgi:peptide/nickel transport system ATP-binding protein
VTQALLDIQDLHVRFYGADGRIVTAVDGLDLSVQAGHVLGLVGESGCGKSVTSLSIMGLLPRDSAEITGRIVFDNQNLLALESQQRRDINGNRISIIFQEPLTSLNPAYPVGEQIVELILRHTSLTRDAATSKAIEVMRQVHVASPEQRFHDYPHRLSGGMRQRIMIAMALALQPTLLIADEPTTALDVTIQAQILELIRSMQQQQKMAVILITHDLGVVAELCDDVAVMYAGQIVEKGPVESIFNSPQHPYTVGLLGSLPRLEQQQARLAAIEGSVPDMTKAQTGCRFADRCPFVIEHCQKEAVPLAPVIAAQSSRCLRAPLERLVA